VQPALVLNHTPESSEVASDDVPGGNVALVVIAGAWIVIAVRYLSHRIALSSDSMNNYVHVWWVARDLWHHGRLPWHMPVLGHGAAYAYPYGFTNWTVGALLWAVFGNWGVTLCTVLGAAACIAATFVAFPELRRGWWAAAALANPAIIQALLFGQQAFAWGAALLFGVAEAIPTAMQLQGINVPFQIVGLLPYALGQQRTWGDRRGNGRCALHGGP